MNLRTVCTTLAIALAACAVSPSFTYADEAVTPPQLNLSISDQLEQLKADIAEDALPCDELSAQIDSIVEQIDDLLDAGADNEIELLKHRKLALSLRTQLKCDLKEGKNGTMLAGGSAGSCNTCSPSGTASYVKVGKRGGGGRAGGKGGIGGVATLGAIAAAIAIPIAVSDSDGGIVASPSN